MDITTGPQLGKAHKRAHSPLKGGPEQNGKAIEKLQTHYTLLHCTHQAQAATAVLQTSKPSSAPTKRKGCSEGRSPHGKQNQLP
eukprot:4330013-Amphidinium_carterae.1